MFRLGRSRSAAAGALVALVALAAGLTQPTSGAAAQTPAAAAGVPDVRTASAPARAYVGQVTLLTGHTVQVSRDQDGRQSAIVDAPAGRAGDTFAFTDGAGDLHVVPREAMPLLSAGRLDDRLFNVTDLLAQGYDDRHRNTIPLIVSYPEAATAAAVTRQARVLRTAGASSSHAFGAADAVTATVAKRSTAAFWDTVDRDATTRSTSRPTLPGGATKVWLDGKVHASLEQSVPLVGAPQAWASGYDGRGVTVAVLDSGYDATHPDLAGRVADSRSFDGTGSVVDGNGHGTHVAATVAGSGDASGGRRKGVAPGARLLVGKVLGATGQGDESWVLAGMEWAATSGAKVVSMSLGGRPTDGTDPLSQAVDSLTASTGALFVVAAGNGGPTSGSVSTPGAATAALTVGNTDKSDQLNRSSSRGPRLGDHAVKPELTAPGTAIIAARAAGTSLGQPVDDLYTSLTGTSMATPHVAGAAAILAQKHPDWTPAQLKSALVGAAKAPASGTVFEHGAGRLDIPAALGATVTATQSTLSFGFLPWPGTGVGPISRTVEYRNAAATPVTLDLATSAAYVGGGPLPPAATQVSPAQLVVPAGGSASATVTVDPTQVGSGDVSGLLVATTDGATIRTPWSYGEEDERYDLTVDATGADGKHSRGWAMVWSKRMGRSYYGVQLNGTGPTSVRLPADDYLVIGGSTSYGSGDEIVAETIGGVPQLALTQDRTVTFDARQGRPLAFRTPRPSKPVQVQLGWSRWYDEGGSMDGQLLFTGNIPRLSIAPSAPVVDGRFEFIAGGRLVAADAEAGRTPYLYDLLLPTDGRLPADGTFRSETGTSPGSTARSSVSGRPGGRRRRPARATPRCTRLRVGGTGDVYAAGPRTDYISANGTIGSPGAAAAGRRRAACRHVGQLPALSAPARGSRPAGGARRTRPAPTPTTPSPTPTDGRTGSASCSATTRTANPITGATRTERGPMGTVRSRLYARRHPADGAAARRPRPRQPTAGAATYRMVHTLTRRGPIWSSSSYSDLRLDVPVRVRERHRMAAEGDPAAGPELGHPADSGTRRAR